MAGMPQVLEFYSALKNVPWGKVNGVDLQKWIDDPKRLAIELPKFLKNFPQAEAVETQPEVQPILCRLYADQTITISARDGSRCIGKQEKLFVKDGIDRDFKNWKLNNRSRATDAVNVEVCEMTKDAKFSETFGSLSSDLDNLCLTQDQILAFCEENRDKLRQDGYATFFLFKENENFFVADVSVDSDGLRVYVSPFGSGYVWYGESRRRVVTPQLTV